MDYDYENHSEQELSMLFYTWGANIPRVFWFETAKDRLLLFLTFNPRHENDDSGMNTYVTSS